MRSFGIDISGYQGVVDWTQVKADPQRVGFAFIKASEGTGGTQPTYKAQWDGAGQVGILRSAYHYHHGEYNGTAQADWFMGQAQKGELPPAVDFEDGETLMTTAITGAAMLENLRACLERIYAVWGVKAIVYTGYWFLFACFNESPAYDARWLANYPLWIAHWTNYGADVTAGQPSKPSWWPWRFWQYSSSGAVDGIKGRCDINLYNGTLDELRAWAGLEPAPVGLTLAEKVEKLWAGHPELW